MLLSRTFAQENRIHHYWNRKEIPPDWQKLLFTFFPANQLAEFTYDYDSVMNTFIFYIFPANQLAEFVYDYDSDEYVFLQKRLADSAWGYFDQVLKFRASYY